MMRQCNTVDMTRRSPSYEIRLAKYSRRAYEVYVPGLKRAEIDPTVCPIALFVTLRLISLPDLRARYSSNGRARSTPGFREVG
jgi:hypothetical protein